jgi:predicted secreted protein
MYAIFKKKKVSPVKLMMHHWLTIPGLKESVTCTSWVAHLANGLDLLENANITYIDTPR